MRLALSTIASAFLLSAIISAPSVASPVVSQVSQAKGRQYTTTRQTTCNYSLPGGVRMTSQVPAGANFFLIRRASDSTLFGLIGNLVTGKYCDIAASDLEVKW